MLQKVSRFIQEHLPDLTQAPVLAAVSGGVDSVVLCHLLQRLDFRFGLAHCHFGLRAADADADEAFVKKLAKVYGAPFFSEHFQTQAFAQEEGLSIQMAARTLRYAWFEQIRAREGFGSIATAHHRNDSAETILLNLTRGTGLAGLHGIPVRNGLVVRPLLAVTKEEVLAYAAEHGLEWREDASNASTKYQRNLVRHAVVPVLRQLNPNLEHTLHQTAERLRGAEMLVNHYVGEAQRQVLREEEGHTYLDLAPLNHLLADKMPALPLVLHELLRPFGFRYDQMAGIIASFPGLSGKSFLSPSHRLTKDRTCLVVTPLENSRAEIQQITEGQRSMKIPQGLLAFRELPAAGYPLNPDQDVVALDAGLLCFPLQVRPWAAGDWFVPLGMTGKKKISDFLIDRKVPRPLKEQVQVLVSGSDIVWVIGYRPDHRYRITPRTERVLEVRKSPSG